MLRARKSMYKSAMSDTNVGLPTSQREEVPGDITDKSDYLQKMDTFLGTNNQH
jgi:hypothetical protein